MAGRRRTAERNAAAIRAATLRRARAFGWDVERCERVIPRPGMPFPLRRDLFGLLDYVAIDPLRWRLVGLQVTSGKEVTAHWRRYWRDELLARRMGALLRCGVLFELWGWSKDGRRWRLRRCEVTDEAIETGALRVLDPDDPAGGWGWAPPDGPAEARRARGARGGRPGSLPPRGVGAGRRALRAVRR